MITVHHLDHSRSQRVLWLLEELGVPYTVRTYKRLPSLLAPAELKAIHPLGKAPVIEDSNLPGRAIAETGAIMDYLLTTYGNGRLVPATSSTERLDYTYWMYAAEGTFMTPLLLKLITDEMTPRSPWLVRPIAAGIALALRKALVTPNLKAHIRLWEDTLNRTPWFAGKAFTAADIMMSFPVEAAANSAGAADKPHIKAWLDAIHARPAYGRALDRGGPYIYAQAA
jgi:glutathione S-transferase